MSRGDDSTRGGRPQEVSPLAFSEVGALRQLREYTLELAGADEAPGLLYRVGFDRGWADGASVAQHFATSGGPPRFAGPPLELLFLPTEGRVPEDFGGVLRGSLEAMLHDGAASDGEATSCHLTAGYAAGWYSAILRETILVVEECCESKGDPHCQFRARPCRSWVEEGDPRVAELLRYLDPPDPLAPLEGKPDEPEQADGAGDLLGNFDPLSPAIHVWGPVMILPYAGVEDAESAIETVQEDVGPDTVRVVILDATGLRIAPAEACGLLEVVSRFESQGLDVVVAGVRRAEEEVLHAGSREKEGLLMVNELSEAIALAFQMASTPSRMH